LNTTYINSQYESLINGYLENGYAILNDCFQESLIDDLRNLAISRYENNDFRLAGIGDRFNFTKEKSIRSDQIYWLPKTGIQGAQQDYMNWVSEFVAYLNYTCFAGILDYNFHYAIYEKGSLYERHSDQFQNRDQRKFSMVLYLSESWNDGDGGELAIYKKESEDAQETRILIEPIPGRFVFFDSALEHEVLPSNTLRVSLTGWMKRRG
jgi:SM-20-related protein